MPKLKERPEEVIADAEPVMEELTDEPIEEPIEPPTDLEPATSSQHTAVIVLSEIVAFVALIIGWSYFRSRRTAS